MTLISIWIVALSAAPSDEHPLAYYLSPEHAGKIKGTARLAGKLREFENDQAEIYDVEYRREGGSQVESRSVLAGPSQAKLREIHRQVNSGGGIFLPTQVAPRESRTHWIKARWKSSDGTITEEYVQRRKDQWLPLDFRPVFEAAQKAVPDGGVIVAAKARLDLETYIYRIDVEGGGDIEVQFRIEDRVIPGEAKFHLGEDAPRLWTRRVSGNGSHADAVAPHPLRYYYPHPCLRRDPQERLLTDALNCLPRDRQNLLGVKSKLREVGQIGEFRIYEIDYRGSFGELERKIRTVLVGRSLDALYEIWLHDSTYSRGDAVPAKIVMAGGTQPLIATNFDDGGMYVFNYEKFFWLGPRGPQIADFSAVGKAAQQAIPKTEGLHQPTTDHGITRLRWRSGTYELKWGFRKSTCCVGSVEVPYTIEEGIAKPVAGKAIYRRQWTY